MEFITSKDNKRVKYVKKLVSSSSFRREEGRFTAEGLRLCADALKSGVSVETATAKMRTGLPVRFESAAGPAAMDCVLIEINDKTGRAETIERFTVE